MKQPPHTITLEPWRDAGAFERAVLNVTTVMLLPLKPDDRMSVLINLLAEQIADIARNEDAVDAIVDSLRMQLKLMVTDSPPIQSND